MFIGSYNADGKKGVMKDGGTKRVEAAKAVAASVGGSIESMYFAFGKDDLSSWPTCPTTPPPRR